MSLKDEYLPVYFEALDLAVTRILGRFDQKGFKTYSKVEQLLFKAGEGQCPKDELDQVCTFFYGDFNKGELIAELFTLHDLHRSAVGDVTPSVDSIKTALLTLSPTQRMLLKTVCWLFQLLLILPATNATSERLFSALRRVKSYLRSTMLQSRLNHLMNLHYHQDMCDRLDMKAIANEYITKNEARRSSMFATFHF